MRIVIFTALTDLEETPWWPVALSTPGVESVLICRKLQSYRSRDVWRRFRSNLSKHGLLFPFYRALLLIRDTIRPAGPSPWPTERASAIPVEVLQAENIHSNAVLERVRTWAPDLGVSIGAPILRPPLFTVPRLGTMNLHLGKVPEFRGAPPGFWEVTTGATEIGATVHWIDAGLDTGQIIEEARAPIYRQDSLADVEDRATELGLEILSKALRDVAEGRAASVPQRSGGHTYRQPTVKQRLRTETMLLRRRLLSCLTNPRFLVKQPMFLVFLYLVRPTRDLFRTLLRRHPVRILTFHRITSLCRDGMTVSPRVFQEQIRYIARYADVVPMDEALKHIRNGTRLRRPLAVITFDDGYRSVPRFGRPIMERFGLTGCCFLSTAFVGTNRRFEHDRANPVCAYQSVMDWPEVDGLLQDGWSIGAHTANHVRLGSVDPALGAKELAAPLSTLRERIGDQEVVLAYPFGGPDDMSPAMLEEAARCGYAACVSNYGGVNPVPSDLLRLKRIDMGGDHETLAWKSSAHGLDLAGWLARVKKAFRRGRG